MPYHDSKLICQIVKFVRLIDTTYNKEVLKFLAENIRGKKCSKDECLSFELTHLPILATCSYSPLWQSEENLTLCPQLLALNTEKKSPFNLSCHKLSSKDNLTRQHMSRNPRIRFKHCTSWKAPFATSFDSPVGPHCEYRFAIHFKVESSPSVVTDQILNNLHSPEPNLSVQS